MTTFKRIAIFNHKGGVGKTSLTANIAFALAKLGQKVLLVDSDPQCSLTTYLADEQAVGEWLNESLTERGRTIWSAVYPVMSGQSAPKEIEPVERRDNLFLIPGDISLSEFEEDLSDAFGDCSKRRIRGYARVTAISRMVENAAKKVDADFVFYDSGPNIGPLNKAIVLDCDGVIIPAACDDFSLRALSTLGHTLVKWIVEWQGLSTNPPDHAVLLRGKPEIIGYIPQRFKVWGGLPASDYSGFMTKLEVRMSSEVIGRIRERFPELAKRGASECKLGEVRDFGQSALRAQREGLPWWEVGGAGAAAEQVFVEIANGIMRYYNG
ncbi:MAG TPA: ParA family protein [bacterium]|jgi:cellulose biosynthesis protein BcsQ